MKTIILILLASSTAAFGQYRMVQGGQVYSIYDPSAWVYFSNLEVISPTTNGWLCRPFTVSVNSSVQMSESAAGRHAAVSNTTERNYGETILLAHYRSPRPLLPGAVIGPVKAALVDIAAFSPEPISQTTVSGRSGTAATTTRFARLESHPVYDVGWDYVPPTAPLTPAQKAAAEKKKQRTAAKTLHWLADQATNGSVSAQFSLGDHYLTGNGTETNVVLGKYWLQKAADAGSVEASNKLASLSQTNKVAADADAN